jgi:hypothetical protein
MPQNYSILEGVFGLRRETRAMQSIKRMCGGLTLCPDDVLHRSALVMRVYRDVVWMTARKAEMMKEEVFTHSQGRELGTALTYLMEFAPTERKQEFEAKVANLFETKWMVDLIDTAMLRVREYPDNGKLYFEILSKCYITVLRYSESELLELLRLERSTFYDRKREATMLLGVSLWGFAIPEIKNVFTGADIKTKKQRGTNAFITNSHAPT